jgi:hypothetical protein
MFPLQAAISFMQLTLLATALKMGSTNSSETSANLHIGTALDLKKGIFIALSSLDHGRAHQEFSRRNLKGKSDFQYCTHEFRLEGTFPNCLITRFNKYTSGT